MELVRHLTPEQVGLLLYCLEQQWSEFSPEEVQDAKAILELLEGDK